MEKVTKTTGEKSTETGGRVVLDRETLIGLRREQGLSQELLAMMCAEQRYCVSIASIKRAETGKKILFRTARDIGLFFDVDLSQIIAAGNDDAVSPGGQAAAVIPSRRKIVALVAELENQDRAGAEQAEYLSSACKLAAGRYDAECHFASEFTAVFLFGSHALMGYEALQALYCLRWLRGQIDMLLKGSFPVAGRVLSLELPGSGEVTEGGVGELIESILGQPVPMSGLMQSDAVGSTLVDGYTGQALQSRFHLSVCPGSEAPDGQPYWQLDDAINEPVERKQFIGRELQCQQFKAATESAYAYGEIQLIYVRGMAGIGKTRLLEEFCQIAESLGIEDHKTHVLDFGAEQSQQAIPRLLRSILHLGDNEVGLGLAELEVRFGQPVCDAAEKLFLYRWLNWPLETRELSLFKAMSYETRSEGLRRVAANLVRRATHKCPLLLCIEDLHWAGDDLLDSIEQLAYSIKDSPVILMMTSRQENDPLKSRWSSSWTDLPLLVMNLSPLHADEADRFADYFADVPEKIRRQCIERAEGNPLFLEQLLCSVGNDTGTLPYSVQSLVQSRLDNLDARSQSAARAASVMGQWFTEAGLQHLMGGDLPDIDPLIEHFLVKRSSERLLFVHALVQQGVYETITESARIDLHRCCAEWFRPVDSALCARHLARAGDSGAGSAYLNATREKIELHAFDEAWALIVEADSLNLDPVDNSALSLSRGEVMQAWGDIDGAIRCYREAVDSASIARQKFAPLIRLANALDTQEQFDEALQILADAETCLNGPDDSLELSQIHFLRGNLYFPRGEVEACRTHHRQALEHARRAQDSLAEARALGGLGDAAYAQGKMLTALDYFEQCLRISRTHNLSQIEAANRFMLGTARIYHNDYELALEDALGSAELAAEVGNRRAEIVSRLTAGWILLDNLNLDAARAQIDRGLVLAREIGARRFEPFLTESLARVYLSEGDPQGAEALLAEAYAQIAQQGIEEFIGPWVIGSYALVVKSASRREELLDEGLRLLQRNCIGHNYFRFYAYAIEAGLRDRDTAALPKFCEGLRQFTREEPTPWSDFYLRRAEAIGRSWTATIDSGLVEELHVLLNDAEQGGLRHAQPLIRATLDELGSSPD